MDTFKRRALTFPALVLGFALVWLLAPVWLAVALLFDAVGRRRWITTRWGLLLWLYVTCELLVVLGALGVSLLRPWFGRRSLRAHLGLQLWWAVTLYAGFRRLFDFQVELTGADALEGAGPLIVLVRHVSQVDTLLPLVYVSYPKRRMLRFVLKHELRRLPAFDLVGGRLPNHFVHRGTLASRGELERVARLAEGLGENEGVVIYPEGTRFSAEKRDRMLKLMARRGDPALHKRASALRHVLPPQLGGTLALLERAPEADAVVLAHTGLEGLRSAADLYSPEILGRCLRVHLWRVPSAQVPRDHEGLSGWLYAQWEAVDAWVEAQRAR